MDYGVVSQELISHLQEMDKFFHDNPVKFAAIGSKRKFEVKGRMQSCTFTYDMNRTGSYEHKVSLQLRYNRTNTTIIRLDINGPEHTNPDGTMTERDHVHVIREENGVFYEWGYNLLEFNQILIKDTSDLYEIFHEFCRYNRILLDGVNIQESI